MRSNARTSESWGWEAHCIPIFKLLALDRSLTLLTGMGSPSPVTLRVSVSNVFGGTFVGILLNAM